MKEKNYVDTTITTLEMCAGYGGIGLGIKNIFGERLRTIAYCELEGFAQANLISKMEKGLLDAAPIWSDLKTFPYESFHGLVDILIAGYPCQPFSAAGKRAGKEDPRHLWPWITDGIRLLQPRMCFFENVEGHVSLGLSTVISDLEEAGYRVEAGIFSAAEIGAPHQRKRVFIMAHRSGDGHNWRPLQDRVCGRSFSQLPQSLFGGCSEIWSKVEGCSNDTRELADHIGERVQELPGQVAIKSQQHSFRDACGTSLWPSRPGQPQFSWEPPRVVANSKHDGLTSCQIRGSTCETIPEQQSWEDNSLNIERAGSIATAESDGMGYTKSRENNGRESRDMDEASGQRGCCDDATDGPSEGLGNSTDRRLGQCNSEIGSVSQFNEGCADTSECSEIEQPMGDSTHGTESRLGISKLSGLSDSELDEIREWMVKTDNRTDELRLLGNGVVPATATRAFLTLLEKLK